VSNRKSTFFAARYDFYLAVVLSEIVLGVTGSKTSAMDLQLSVYGDW